MRPEDVVRAYFAVYNEGQPERFHEVVSNDYVDYGQTVPGCGPQGARNDYEHAVQLAGGVIQYEIAALIADEDRVAATWTGRLPNGSRFRGLSLYRVAEDRVTEARNTFIDQPPAG